MLFLYNHQSGRLRDMDAEAGTSVGEAVWVDLFKPSREDEAVVESALSIDIPTREEMEEIEVSSRLYLEGDAAFMTAAVLTLGDGDEPVLAPATFVLTGQKLVTIRYEEPRAFRTIAARIGNGQVDAMEADALLTTLLELTVERLADLLEQAAKRIDATSANVFQEAGAKTPKQDQRFQLVIRDLGRTADFLSKARESLVTLERLFAFHATVAMHRNCNRDIRSRVKALSRDARSLADHVGYLSQKITFLLDATLGMINIEQNATIKIFSVVAVIFLPPTLIASIYGMNFEFMPELAWPFGYPLALGAMVLSAVLPYLFFKLKGWL